MHRSGMDSKGCENVRNEGQRTMVTEAEMMLLGDRHTYNRHS